MSFAVPAVLADSSADLAKKLSLVTRLPDVRRVQIDVVDGRYAAPACWPYTAPAEFVAMRASGTFLPKVGTVAYEIDLMCLNAETAAGQWLALGASRLTLHYESTTDPARLIMHVRGEHGADAAFKVPHLFSLGLAVGLATELALLEPYLASVDYVQLMGIATIGRQGEPFDKRTLARAAAFKKLHPDIPLQVDGGVSLATARELVKIGVDSVIVGSALMHASDPAATFAAIEALESPFGI